MLDLHDPAKMAGEVESAQDAVAPGKQTRSASVQMQPAAQMAPAPGAAPAGAAPAGAAPAGAAAGGASDALIDQMIAAMGMPPLPKKPAQRVVALRKLGMTPESATASAREMFAPKPGDAPAGGAPGGGAPAGGAPAAQGKLQAKGDPLVRDVDVSNGGGSPLNPDIAQAMGSAMGHDFSSVSVHQDGQAEAIGAQAFTVGDHLHFAQGKLDTSSEAGLSLLGHELTHVVQQSAGRVSAPGQAKSAGGNAVNIQDPGLEAEADEIGARAAAQVSGSVRGASPTASTAQMKAEPSMVGGLGTVQAKPVVQCEIVTISALVIGEIAGYAVTVGEAVEAAGAVVAVTSTAASFSAPTQATTNSAGTALRLPQDQGATFSVSETGRDIVAALIRVKAAKSLKTVAEQAAAKAPGDESAKTKAARDAVAAQEPNATANATTQVKNAMLGKVTGEQSQTFTWNDQNGVFANPTYGNAIVTATAGGISAAEAGVDGGDWATFHITQPAGSGCKYFRSVRLSAYCTDSTVEWWDFLEVSPTRLQFVDGGDGGLKATGEVVFQWEKSRTTMQWLEENPMVNSSGSISLPTRNGVPSDNLL